jgi:hypothetical protein
MRPRTPLLFLAALGAVVSVAFAARTADPPAAAQARALSVSAAARGGKATKATDATLESASRPPRLDEDPSTFSACAAPSVLRLHAPDDATDPAVSSCVRGDTWASIADREQAAAARCDQAGRRVDLARLLEGALPLDEATTQHVRLLFRVGRSQGRRADAFGLVGDSMTVSGHFLRPFAAGGAAVLPADVRRALTLDVAPARSVIDVFRGRRDSFLALRAAKVGVRASWPLTAHPPEESSPLDAMVASVSPAYAVVLYGANDAVWRTDSLPLLTREFTGALGAVVDALEARGIIPILTTVPKHMREPGFPDCPSPARPLGEANERFAAQATALSAAVADLACRRHLPLVDLRWALDPLLDHGVGPDGVHLSVHPQGGGVLDASGLECGYNVRNLVTLRELARVVDAASSSVW